MRQRQGILQHSNVHIHPFSLNSILGLPPTSGQLQLNVDDTNNAPARFADTFSTHLSSILSGLGRGPRTQLSDHQEDY